MARQCKECGTAIPWGVPQCVGCGSYTHWRDRLSLFGISIGAGTVLVVLVSLGWVWLAPPPDDVRAAGEVQELLRQLDDSELRVVVAGAGRCKAEVAAAVCVQTTAALEALDGPARARTRQRIAALWTSIADAAPHELVFVNSNGELEPVEKTKKSTDEHR